MVIDGWHLAAFENADEWCLYKLAEDGQPNPATVFPGTRIDELFAHTREDGDREVLIALQSALDFLAADPEDCWQHHHKIGRAHV